MTSLRTAALAARWQCSTKTVKRIRDAGLIEYVAITRGHVLFPLAAVEAYEAKRTRKPRKGL